MLMLSPGSYQDRFETFHMEWLAGIDVVKAKNPVLIDNIVAGSERVGFLVAGQACENNPNPEWSGNIAHSLAIGVNSLNALSPCARVSGFLIYKCYDWGIYLNSPSSYILEDLVMVDNKVSVFTFSIGPGPVSHQWKDMFAIVRNSVFVGTSPSFDCATDTIDTSDDNFKLGSLARPFSYFKGNTAIAWPTFSGGGNGVPMKPWKNTMSYPTINGIANITSRSFIYSFILIYYLLQYCFDTFLKFDRSTSCQESISKTSKLPCKFRKYQTNISVLDHLKVRELISINVCLCLYVVLVNFLIFFI